MLQKVSHVGTAGMEDSQPMATPIAAPDKLTAAAALDALRDARERTLAIVASISESDLERVHSTLMSPLVWDLGHIAAFEDLWMVHRFGGRPLLREDLADVYDAFETPRCERGELPFLRPPEARAYLEQVRDRTLEVIDERGTEDGNVLELVVRHEHQHCETMLQTIELARLRDYELTGRRPEPVAASPHLTGLELTALPGGECLLGAGPAGFAYDNERPRHRTDVRGYLLGRAPITNASYLTFVEGGGYERREWWSDEGWAWKEQYDITRPMGWAATLDAEWRLGTLEELRPTRPVVHVSWF
jgi:gamma-glutamyl hercynylcysteine S-oxide synthase